MPILQHQDIAKHLAKGQFAQNLKNESDIYEHVLDRDIKKLLKKD